MLVLFIKPALKVQQKPLYRAEDISTNKWPLISDLMSLLSTGKSPGEIPRQNIRSLSFEVSCQTVILCS